MGELCVTYDVCRMYMLYMYMYIYIYIVFTSTPYSKPIIIVFINCYQLINFLILYI